MPYKNSKTTQYLWFKLNWCDSKKKENCYFILGATKNEVDTIAELFDDLIPHKQREIFDEDYENGTSEDITKLIA